MNDVRISITDKRDGLAAAGSAHWRFLLAVAAGALLLYVFGVARVQFLTGDPTYYVGLANAIAQGDGYRFMGVPHTQYPPGLPLLLAPVVRLFGTDPLVAQVAIAITGAVGIVAVLVFMRSRPRPLSLAMALILVGSASYFGMATAGIHSELPFVVCSFGALTVFAHLRSAPVTGTRWMWAGIAAGLTALAVALRTIGVALPAAFAAATIHHALRRRRDPRDGGSSGGLLAMGTPAVAGGIAFVAWMVWSGQDASAPSYMDLLMLRDPHWPDLGTASVLDIAARLPRALLIQTTHYLELAVNLPWLKPLWTSPAVVLALVMTMAGIVGGLRGAHPAHSWYLLSYLGIVLLWPFDEGARFLLPILPLMLLATYDGMQMLWQRFRSLDPPGQQVILRVGSVVALVGCVLVFVEDALADDLSRQTVAAAGVWAVAALPLGVVALSGRARGIVTRLAPRALPLVGALYVAGYLLVGSVSLVPFAIDNVRGVDRSPNRQLRDAIPWLREHASPRDVVMSEFASSVYFYTELPAVPFPKTADRARLVATLDSSRTRYLGVNAPLEFSYYRPTEQERLEVIEGALGPRLQVAYEYDGGTIYAIDTTSVDNR